MRGRMSPEMTQVALPELRDKVAPSFASTFEVAKALTTRNCHARFDADAQTTPDSLVGYCSLASFSTASAAESFRSRCGSVRRVPVCSSQASPIAAPQVVQGTDNICFGVSSFVFTST